MPNRSLDNKRFQNHLLKIVSIPVLFLLILLIFFHFQSEYIESLFKANRQTERLKLVLVKLETQFSDIENNLRGYILSGNVRFKTNIHQSIDSVDPLVDEAFKEIGGDFEQGKKFRNLMKSFNQFKEQTMDIVHIRESNSPSSEQSAETRLLTKSIYEDVKVEATNFLREVESKNRILLAKIQKIRKTTAVLEIIFTLVLVFFVAFFMIRQIKRLTYNYRRLLQLNFENMEELKKSSNTKDLFLANMSHEIRTPLGSILGFADLLSERPGLDPEVKSHISFIKRNSQHLLSLIDDLFDISRLAAEKLEFHLEKVNLSQFIDDIENYFLSMVVDKKIDLDIRLDTRIPEIIEADLVRLKQIVTNLVGNAIKFSPEKSKVSVVFSYSNDCLQVDVIDQGIGIDSEAQKIIFEAFSQADTKHSRKFGGAGLGLSISKKLATALKGDLELVSSRVNIGSHFRLTLPSKVVSNNYLDRNIKDEKNSKTTKAPSEEKPEKFDFTDKNVLLAEDSKENQILFKIFLESTKANLTVVDNGTDAVRKALADDFDIILMDIQMPGLDGYEAVNILRGSHYNKKIIALTAHAMKGEREKCLSAGFDEYVSKPVSQQKLLRTIDKVLT